MAEHFSSVKIDDIVMNAIYGYYVKYDVLTKLINKEYAGSNANTLNLFIDVNNVLCKIEDLANRYNVNPSSNLVIMSGLINMAAHYRQFFRSRYGCATRIWLINSINNVISPLYDQSFLYAKNHPKNISTMIDGELMEMVCNYIPDVMYYQCSVEFTTGVAYIISKENNTFPSLVITKDNFAFQLAGHQNVKVLRPSKNKNGDYSYIINSDNLTQTYLQSLKSNETSVIPSSLIAVLMAMTRVPSRGVSSLIHINKALELLSYGILVNSNLMKYPWDPQYYFQQLSDAINVNRIPTTNIIQKDIPFLVNRFKAIECVYFHLIGYKDMPEALMFKGMINLYDPKGVKEINEKYFKDCPLDLEVF